MPFPALAGVQLLQPFRTTRAPIGAFDPAMPAGGLGAPARVWRAPLADPSQLARAASQAMFSLVLTGVLLPQPFRSIRAPTAAFDFAIPASVPAAHAPLWHTLRATRYQLVHAA